MFNNFISKKVKLIVYVVIVFVFILILFGCFSVYNSCKIINKQTYSNFISLVENMRDSENHYFQSVEEEVGYCKKFIEVTLDEKKFKHIVSKVSKYDKHKVPYVSGYLDSIVSPLLLYSTTQVKDLVGIYFHLDHKLLKHKELMGIWYTYSPKKGIYEITDNGLSSSMEPENSYELNWFYAPKKQGKAVWSDLYVDMDLKAPMITFSAPVYGNGKFIGVVGIDLEIDCSGHLAERFNNYKNAKSYLIDKNNKIMFAKDYKPLTDISEVNKELGKFISDDLNKSEIDLNVIKTIKSGDNLFAIAPLYNGFTLIIEIPVVDLYGAISKLIKFTAYALVLAIALSVIIAFEAYGRVKRINTQLIQKEKLISVGTMAAEIAHEINNPLGYISCNMETLEKFLNKIKDFMSFCRVNFEKVASGETTLECEVQRIRDYKKELKMDFVMESIVELIEESREGIDKVSRTVLSLKNFTKDVTNDAKTKENIGEMIDKSLAILNNKIGKDVKIIKSIDNIPPILCHRGQLEQVFVNLIDNANYSVLEKNHSDKRIIITACKRGNCADIEIEDNGIGIEKSKLNTIFEPFFTTKAYGHGTGLGLSIVYEIVTNKHNGEILVESKKGKGCKFIIKIPY